MTGMVSFTSFMRNCRVRAREGDGPLFVAQNDEVTARLDGYAVIPVEEFEAAEKRIAELEEALRAAQETIGAFTDGRNRAEARIVELKQQLKHNLDASMQLLDDLAKGRSRIAELEARETNSGMAEGALEAIHRLLDSGGIPRGTYADDHVRNLVALYNQRGDLIAELENENKALKFDLDNAHDGRNEEAIARCETEDRLAELESTLEATRLSYETSLDITKKRAEKLSEIIYDYELVIDKKNKRIAELESALKRAASSTDNC